MFGSSPQHIAAYHVFHRLLVPRHPPVALNNLFIYGHSFPSLFDCKRAETIKVSAKCNTWIVSREAFTTTTKNSLVKDRFPPNGGGERD